MSSELEKHVLDRKDLLTIGEVSRRSGMAPSALRYYESVDLITSTRTSGDRRRYRRAVLRRLAVIRAAQTVGLSLDEIRESFAQFGPEAAPTKKEWAHLSSTWRPLLERRISDLEKVRDSLDSCVGCGCLSMQQCWLYNPNDRLSAGGPGARRLLPGA